MKKVYYNLFLFIPLIILNIISLLNMYNAKLISYSYNNAFIKELLFIIIGYLIIFIINKINIKRLLYYSKYLYILSIILLILVLFLGNNINGSKCWLNIFGISFQPSELCKLSLLLYLIDIKNNSKKNYLFVIKSIIITFIPSILTYLEPDTGSIINYLIILFTILILSKLNKWWYISFISISIILLSSFIIIYIYYKDILLKIIGSSLFYRIDRIINFINGNSYQLENALTVVGASSFINFNINKIMLYIPEAPTDFIFAFSIGNFGLLSAFLILISYYIIDIYLINDINKYDTDYKMFILSFFIIFLFHQIYNIFMNIGLLPIMGIPLPFLSYGGTNIIINYIFIGIIFKIKKYPRYINNI